MIEQDTIRLLRECDSGTRMGAASIDEVLGFVKDEKLMKCLTECRQTHEKLREEIDGLLAEYRDEGKEPSGMAKGMSWLKIHAELLVDESDATVAAVMTDGCNMGVKSLSRYLNEYGAADEKAKAVCKRLIASEEKLAEELRTFL